MQLSAALLLLLLLLVSFAAAAPATAQLVVDGDDAASAPLSADGDDDGDAAAAEAAAAAAQPVHRCIHDEMMRDAPPSVRSVQRHESDALSADERKRGVLAAAPIRILLDTSLLERNADVFPDNNRPLACWSAGQTVNNGFTCRDRDVLTTDKKDWLKKRLLPDAEKVLRAALNVDPIAGALVLRSTKCGFQERVPVPAAMRGAGVPYDLVIFVTVRPIPQEGTLAFAGECEQDATTRRAVAGQLNYSPASLKPNQDYDGQLGTTLHEIAHVLGMSKGKWSQFVDKENAFAVRPRGDVIKAVSNYAGKASTEVMYTTEVLRFVRQHFGCSTLPGAELEDGGAEGTALSHWDKRTFMNEYMTGQATRNPVFSQLTLAMFADSGWYASVNYDAAEPLVWGRDQKCSFATAKCNQQTPPAWPRLAEYPGYYCTDRMSTTCSFDLRGKATCSLQTWDPAPPPEFRYFPSEPNKGGPSALADYCPYYSTYDYCTDTSKQAGRGEKRCANCRCFETAATSIAVLDQALQASLGCFEMACVSESAVKVAVDGTFYDCPPGAEVTAEGLAARIKCPKEAVIKAQCAGAVVDGTWPSVTGVSPAEGNPETTEITVTGTGFTNATTIDIHGPTTVVRRSGSTSITVTIKDSEHLQSPTHLLPMGEVVNVVATNPDTGRSAVLSGAFTVKVVISGDIFERTINWMTDNPLYAAIGGAAVLLACLCCIYCCCSGGGGDGGGNKRHSSYGDSHLYR